MVDTDGQVPQDLGDEKVGSFVFRRNFMETFLDNCHNVGMDIMQIVEQGLELPKGELVDRFSTKVDECRPNYCSPLPTEKLVDGKHQRAWPHTDFEMLTLLFQDEVPRRSWRS